MKDEIKEIREYISCPQFGDDHYGKWGALRLDQRKKIKDLLDYITNLQEENQRLKENNQNMQIEMSRSWERIDKAIEYINKELIPYGEEWFWDDYAIKDYVDKVVNILKGDKND